MKDYIYPLHNVTLDIALGEERSVRMYSPNAASGPISQHGTKIKCWFFGQLLIIRTNTDAVEVQETQ